MCYPAKFGRSGSNAVGKAGCQNLERCNPTLLKWELCITWYNTSPFCTTVTNLATLGQTLWA